MNYTSIPKEINMKKKKRNKHEAKQKTWEFYNLFYNGMQTEDTLFGRSCKSTIVVSQSSFY